MTKAEWTKTIRKIVRRKKNADGPFVDYVILGMQRRFITEQRAVDLLTHTERLPRSWTP